MKKNDIVEIEITALSSECSGIGKKDGMHNFEPITPIGDKHEEKILKEKETEYMKNSLALGMSREYAVIRLILPVCAVELLGTVALGMAYGMGAVAPILYTGAVMVADVPGKLTDPFMSLPYHLYMLVNNGFSLD